MKKLLTLLTLFIFGIGYAQVTQIPDANFEQELIDQGIDNDGILNDEVATADIFSLGFLSIQGTNITDATGIEAFTSLIGLTLKGNSNLTSINVSN